MRYRNLFNTALGLSLFCLPLAIIPEAFARVGDDAVVLPKGYSRLFFDAEFYIPFEKRYDSNGNVEALGADFNTNLNSSVFPALAGFGPGATLGQSVVSYKRYLQQYLLQPAYGLTDRLTIGANIPYVSIKNDIGASLDTSGATVGKSPFSPFPSMLAPCSAPGCATGGPIPGTTPLTTNDVQNLLASQGFKPIKTWENSGFGDVEVGGRYQYYRSEFFRSAFTGGVRFPTGWTRPGAEAPTRCCSGSIRTLCTRRKGWGNASAFLIPGLASSTPPFPTIGISRTRKLCMCAVLERQSARTKARSTGSSATCCKRRFRESSVFSFPD